MKYYLDNVDKLAEKAGYVAPHDRGQGRQPEGAAPRDRQRSAARRPTASAAPDRPCREASSRTRSAHAPSPLPDRTSSGDVAIARRPASTPSSGPAPRGSDRSARPASRAFLLLCAAITVLTTAGIILVLGVETLEFFRMSKVGLLDFLFGTELKPRGEPAAVRHPAADLGDVRDRRGLVADRPADRPAERDLPERVRPAAASGRSSSRRWSCWRASRRSSTAISPCCW